MKKTSRKAYSLVELVVVILIIAILAAAVFLGGATVIQQSRESAVKTDLSNFASYVQDMMYANPELQYHSSYATNQGFTYDTATKNFTPKVNGAVPTSFADLTNKDKLDMAKLTDMTALYLLQDKYLTADFQLGNTVDAWDNPYCFSYDQLVSAGTGKTSSCVIVINSLGTNAMDETSDDAKNGKVIDSLTADAKTVKPSAKGESIKIAKQFVTGMGKATNYKLWDSAEEFVNSLQDKKNDDGTTAATFNGDDYGVVICMIDGAVSTAYYGF